MRGPQGRGREHGTRLCCPLTGVSRFSREADKQPQRQQDLLLVAGRAGPRAGPRGWPCLGAAGEACVFQEVSSGVRCRGGGWGTRGARSADGVRAPRRAGAEGPRQRRRMKMMGTQVSAGCGVGEPSGHLRGAGRVRGSGQCSVTLSALGPGRGQRPATGSHAQTCCYEAKSLWCSEGGGVSLLPPQKQLSSHRQARGRAPC